MKRKITLTKLSTLLMLFIFTFGILVSNSVCKAAYITDYDDSYLDFYKWQSNCSTPIFNSKKGIFNHMHQNMDWLIIDDIISITSSDESVIKVNSDGKVISGDCGFAFINISIRETEKYKAFNYKIYVLVYPPAIGGVGTGQLANKKTKIQKGSIEKINQKNSLFFCQTFVGENSSFEKVSIGKNSKCVFQIASDKNFKHIIKEYDLSPKYYNKAKEIKIKNIKKLKLKKNKTYYARAYAFHKYNDDLTLYCKEYGWFKFKFNKKGYLPPKNYDEDLKEMKKNPSDKEILQIMLGITEYNTNHYFNHWKFDQKYLKQ